MESRCVHRHPFYVTLLVFLNCHLHSYRNRYYAYSIVRNKRRSYVYEILDFFNWLCIFSSFLVLFKSFILFDTFVKTYVYSGLYSIYFEEIHVIFIQSLLPVKMSNCSWQKYSMKERYCKKEMAILL